MTIGLRLRSLHCGISVMPILDTARDMNLVDGSALINVKVCVLNVEMSSAVSTLPSGEIAVKYKPLKPR